MLKDRYRPIQPIGKGGFGRTLLSEDTDRLNAFCVIKQFLPLPEIQSDSEAMAKATELFQQEAMSLLQLGEQHPQIPTLFAYLEQDRRLYLVQQYIDGQDLYKELEQQGAFSEQKIRGLLNDLLPVLQFIHQHKVIHRDIKPSNILRRKIDGKLVLIDFGVSKQLSGCTNLSKTGTGGYGTPVYAPVEQMRSGKVYPASDFYSLGVTCIQLLTQAPLDELYDPMKGRWAWREYLQERGKDVSDQLSQVLEKLLKDLVNERYQLASEVLEELNAHASIPSPPPLPENEYQLPTQNLQKLTALQYRPSTSTSQEVTSAPLGLNSSANLQTDERCLHTLTAHSSYVYSLIYSPDGGAGTPSPPLLVSGSADKTIKLWQLGTEGLPQDSLPHTLSGHSDWILSVAISPDAKTLASASVDKTIKLWDMGTGKLLGTLSGHLFIVTSVAFSPDGQTLVSGSGDRTIKVWHVDTNRRSSPGSLLRTLNGHANYVYSVAFNPDGQTLASASWDNTIKLWQTSTGQLLHTFKDHSQYVRCLAMSPDGRAGTPSPPLLASGSYDKTIKIWHLGGAGRSASRVPSGSETSPIRTLTGHSNWILSMAISPDGKILASGSQDKTIKIWHLGSGKLLHTLTGHSGAVYSVAFSPDGQILVSGSEDKTIKFWRCDWG